MADSREKVPASQDKAAAIDEPRGRTTDEPRRTGAERRAPTASEQQAELNVQAFNIEASRRTGVPVNEAADLVERLQTKGDFFDEQGRWTLDVAGYPVCHKGWKPDATEPVMP